MATPERIGAAAPSPALRDSGQSQSANGPGGHEAATVDVVRGVGSRPTNSRTALAEKVTLEVMAFPWVGQVIRCEALGERSGIMIVVEGSDWLSRATLSWSMNDGEGGRTEFIVGRRGLSQRESERDFLSRRECLRAQGEDG